MCPPLSQIYSGPTYYKTTRPVGDQRYAVETIFRNIPLHGWILLSLKRLEMP